MANAPNKVQLERALTSHDCIKRYTDLPCSTLMKARIPFPEDI